MTDETKARLTITLPPGLRDELRILAKKNQRSLSGEIVYALRQWADHQKKLRIKE